MDAKTAVITKDLISQHGLSDEEYKKIVEILGREPNLTELGMFSVMWSEHCSYKSSRVHLKRLPTTGPRVVQGPGENAGAVDIGDGLVAVFKMESHNHPSFIEPYQGAATGVGGILRDIFTMGARPIALLDSLRFGLLDRPQNRHLFKGVVTGIAAYGNCLPGHERVVIKSNGNVSDIRLDELAGNYFAAGDFGIRELEPGTLEVLSFDPIASVSRWVGIRRIFKQRSREMIRIKTALGRSLRMTPDHPASVYRNGQFQVVPASDLKPGDEVPVIAALPCGGKFHDEIDLIDVFKPRSENIFVRVKRPIAIPPAAIRPFVQNVQARHRYRTKQTMPLKLFLELEGQIKASRKEAELYIPSGKANYIRSVLPIDGRLVRLIGYFLSEGCISRNGTTYKLIWTFGKHERSYVEDVCGILDYLEIRKAVYVRRSTIAITVSSWFLGVLFKELWKTGCDATEKSIPSFLLDAPRDLKIELLKGLFRGDGSVSFYPSGSRVKIRYATTSERLFHQVVVLLQDLGLIPYIYRSRQRDSEIEGRPIKALHDIWNLEVQNFHDVSRLMDWFSTETNSKITKALQAYPNGGRIFSNPRSKKHKNFWTVRIQAVTLERTEEDVYDLEVNELHLFVTTSGLVTHNCVGVPTVGGEVAFNEIYAQNPLVNVFCLGIAKKDRLFKGLALGAGNPVIYVGSKTGRDGIHGATMASDAFDQASEAKRPTVQVGDPFTEKLLLEACLELMSGDLLVGIQDMGAAGLTSSSCEMASRAGTGIDLDLTQVPRREPGMTPYELMLSESQERMLMVARQGKEQEVLKICRKWDLDAAVVGRVTGDGKLRVWDAGTNGNNIVVAEIPAKALADDGPRYERPSAPPAYQEWLQSINLEALPDVKDPTAVLLSLLESPTIASKAWVYRQYDHMVRTNTLIRPGSDAAVLRVKGTNKAIAMTTDGSGRYCLLNPYLGATLAVAEASRNLVCSGAEPIGLTDCLNFGNPERPDIMWQFILSIEGIADACNVLNIPVVSGNVSFYNETNGLSIYPTPILGMVGLIEPAERATTQWFKQAGDRIILLGTTKDDLGGTEYLRVVHAREQGAPPALSLDEEKAVQRCVLKLIGEGQVRSAHDCSDGGLAVALAECCLSNPAQPTGAVVRLAGQGLRLDSLLFGESQSRVVLSVSPDQADRVLRIAAEVGVVAVGIGQVGGERLVIEVADDRKRPGCRIDVDLATLQDRWANSLQRSLDET